EAYRAGRAALGGDGLPEPAPPLESMRDLLRLDAALARLSRLAPRAKRRVLEAVLATIRHDRRIGTEELELFRAIAATLGCPLPRFGSLRGLLRLDAAPARLSRLAPRAKRRVLEAVLATIRHDRRIGTEELELFRAIAATLGCPLPWDIGLRKRWGDVAADET